MYDIPISITLKDKVYNIRNKGDYRLVLDCFQALNDIELTEDERIIACLMIFYEDFNTVEDVFALNEDDTLQLAVSEMYKFFNCGEAESPGAKMNYRLIDWDKDSQIICSAINNVAGKEIRMEPYIHWWSFMGYYIAVGRSTLAEVVSIREKIVKGKKLEKYEREFKNSNPQYFNWNHKTLQDQEDEAYIRQLWNSGK